MERSTGRATNNAGDGDNMEYRTICLISVFSKWLERLVEMKLEEEIENKEGLSPRQFGNRRGKSTLRRRSYYKVGGGTVILIDVYIIRSYFEYRKPSYRTRC